MSTGGKGAAGAGALRIMPNIADPDGFLAELLAAHRDLSPEAGAALNARLVLILANHIGDRVTLSSALALARGLS